MGDATKKRKKQRGRPVRIDPSIVVDSADTFRVWFHQFWPKLGPAILSAKSAKEVGNSIREHAPSISGGLTQFADLILKIVRDRRFPQARAQSQLHFLADSLGGQGLVTPRRSREICAAERSKVHHVIMRREYYIECSCGYKGPALDNSCRDCGATELSWELKVKDIEAS